MIAKYYFPKTMDSNFELYPNSYPALGTGLQKWGLCIFKWQQTLTGQYVLVMPIYLSSCGCWKKPSQTWWFKSTEIYSVMVLEVITLKSVSLGQNQRVGGARLVHRVQGGICSMPLPASGACQHSLACSHITSIFKAKPRSIFKPLFFLHITFSSSQPLTPDDVESLSISLLQEHVIAFSVYTQKTEDKLISKSLTYSCL